MKLRPNETGDKAVLYIHVSSLGRRQFSHDLQQPKEVWFKV